MFARIDHVKHIQFYTFKKDIKYDIGELLLPLICLELYDVSVHAAYWTKTICFFKEENKELKMVLKKKNLIKKMRKF